MPWIVISNHLKIIYIYIYILLHKSKCNHLKKGCSKRELYYTSIYMIGKLQIHFLPLLPMVTNFTDKRCYERCNRRNVLFKCLQTENYFMSHFIMTKIIFYFCRKPTLCRTFNMVHIHRLATSIFLIL